MHSVAEISDVDLVHAAFQGHGIDGSTKRPIESQASNPVVLSCCSSSCSLELRRPWCSEPTLARSNTFLRAGSRSSGSARPDLRLTRPNS